MVDGMNRTEFIEKLRIALAGNINHNIIEDNVRFYNDYMDAEIKKGKSEEVILSELGDPRLIAKTIIETNKHMGKSQDGQSNIYDEEDSNAGEKQTQRAPFLKLNGFLTGIFIIIGIILVISLFSSVIAFLSPVLLPLLLFFVVYRAIRRLQ